MKYHLQPDVNKPYMRHLINEETGNAIGTIEKKVQDYSVSCFAAKKSIRINDEKIATDFIIRLYETIENRKKSIQLRLNLKSA